MSIPLVLSAAVSSLLWAQVLTGNEAEQEAKLARKITVDKEISGSLEKVLETLSDRFDMTFVVDMKAFEDQGHKDFLKVQVKVPARKDVEMRQVLLELLKPLRGNCKPAKGYVDISPATKKQAPGESPLGSG